MKPKDLINNYVTNFLKDELLSNGFTYSESKIQFCRKKGPFVQKIDIPKSKWNQENTIVDFWIILSVESNFYFKWHLKKYEYEPLNNLIYSDNNQYINGWNKKYMNEIGRYELIQNNATELMEIIKWNLINIGIPKLDIYSEWESAANETIKDELIYKYINVSDYFILMGNIKKGYQPLLDAQKFFLKKLGENNDSYTKERLNEIDIRISKNYS